MPRPLRRAVSAGLVTLLATAGVVGLGASVAQADSGQVFSGTLQAGDATWMRGCNAPQSGVGQYYDTLDFTVPETGSYGIDMDAHSLVGGGEETSTDGYFYLFSPGFDAANPSASCIASNDDDAGSLRPRIIADLTAGTTYTLVTTQFNNPANDSVYTYSGSIRGLLQSVELAPSGGQEITLQQGETAQLTATFSAPVTGFDASDLGLGADAGDAVVTGSGTEYEIAFTPSSFGIYDLRIPYGAALTAGGSTHTESDTARFRVEQPDPTPTITPVGSGTVTAEPALFDVVFSEPVTGLEASDVVLGGTAGATGVALEGEGSQYRITVTDFAQLGTIEVSLPEGAAFGTRTIETEGPTIEVEIPSVASNVATVSYETAQATAPSVTVEQAADQADPAAVLPVAFDVTFSEPIDELQASDVVLGGTAGSTTVTVESLPGDAPNMAYRVLVTDAAQAGTITVSIPAGAVVNQDLVGNTASTSVDDEVTYAPVVAPAPTTPAAPPVAGAGGTLPQTGGEPGVLVALAAMLLVAVGAVAARRGARVTR